jgi:hypothetical protein
MWNNMKYRVKVYAEMDKKTLLDDIQLISFIRNDAAAKHALHSNAKRISTREVTPKVYESALHFTPYFSFFHDRQVFLEIYLPKVDIAKYLW